MNPNWVLLRASFSYRFSSTRVCVAETSGKSMTLYYLLPVLRLLPVASYAIEILKKKNKNTRSYFIVRVLPFLPSFLSFSSSSRSPALTVKVCFNTKKQIKSTVNILTCNNASHRSPSINNKEKVGVERDPKKTKKHTF